MDRSSIRTEGKGNSAVLNVRFEMDVFSEIAPYGKAKSKSAHIRLWIWAGCVVLTIIAVETKAELVTWNAAASVLLKYIAFVRQVWYFILIFFIVMCIKEIYLTNKYTKNIRYK